MQSLNFTEFRQSLKTHLDNVSDNHDTVIINRSGNRDVVVISLKEWNSMKETNYLNSSKKNRERLESALEKSKRGEVLERGLIDL